MRRESSRGSSGRDGRVGLSLALCALCAAGALSGCPSTPTPGEYDLGSFAFEATYASDDCPFGDGGVVGPGLFSGRVSVTPEKGRGYLTVGSQSLSGSFAENRLEVSGSAKRELPSPCSCSGTITETVIGRLVERGAGATCEGLPDAGLADAATGASPDVDWAERTFDLFCDGLIVDKFEPSSADCPADVGCPCESGCEARFLLKGVRRGEQILE